MSLLLLFHGVAAAVDEPFKQAPADNPRSPPRVQFSYSFGVNLSLLGQDKFFGAPGQPPTYDWPAPLWPKYSVSLRSWEVNLQQTTLAQPFFQTDWPNPLRQPLRPATHTDPFKLNLSGQDRFFGADGQGPTYDWPQPGRAKRPDVTWTLNSLRPDVQAPFVNPDWQAPRRPQPPPGTWTLNLLQSTLSVEQAPFAQFDWPVPKKAPGLSPNFVSLNLQQSLLARPFFQTEWPVPQQARRSTELRTWLDPVKINLIGQDTFFDGAGRSPVYDWPNPKRPSLPTAFIALGLQTTTLSAGQPFRFTGWENPLRARQGPPFQPPNISLTTLAGQDVLPFRRTDWPRPVSVQRLNTSWVRSLVQAVDTPFVQFDWPKPRRSPSAAQSITFGLPTTTLAPSQPFNLTNWDKPLRPRQGQPFQSLNLNLTTLAINRPIFFGYIIG